MDQILCTETATPTNRRFRWFEKLMIALLLAGVVGCLTVAAGIASFFRSSPEVRALSAGARDASGAEWHRMFALNLGGTAFGLLRGGLSFAKLDDAPRAAIGSIRGCEVAIYQTSDSNASGRRGEMLARADEVMAKRGWERLVGVMEDDALVGVYAPTNLDSASTVRFCVLVFDGRELILASARADVESVLELVRSKNLLPPALAENQRDADSASQDAGVPKAADRRDDFASVLPASRRQ